ncbi:unnamed protein product [Menidia menidia]|uniref:(Atlantic silverside) hypothetical protein n=1 Tax=Menidia menidia TaxID=238744 RepID=A0A8S4BW75_9TELE|nr:unnamed protein product [Menidia menidia]
MLHLFGTVAGLIFIIFWFSKGLKQEKKNQKAQASESSGSKMKDLSGDDLHLLTKILSVGLVDADPNYLQHLKGYRDLTGS